MNQSQEPRIVLDTNVIGALMRKGSPLSMKEWQRRLLAAGVIEPGMRPSFALPTFSMLEILGITNFPPVSSFPQTFRDEYLRDPKRWREVLIELHQKALEELLKRPEFCSGALMARASERLQYIIDPHIQAFVRDLIVAKASLPEIEHYIAQHVAWDVVFKTQMPSSDEEFSGKFVQCCLILLFDIIDQEQNISCFRAAVNAWRGLYRKALARAEAGNFSLSVTQLERINKALTLKTNKDMLDCELIHFAVLGWRTHGRTVPVRIVTADPPAVIKDRVIAYRSLIQFQDELTREHAGAQGVAHEYPPIQEMPGVVYCFDNDGICVEVIDVARVLPLR